MTTPGVVEVMTRAAGGLFPYSQEMSADLIKAADAVRAMGEALDRCSEYMAERSDVIDGDYGVPAPNEEMTIAREIDAALTQFRSLK